MKHSDSLLDENKVKIYSVRVQFKLWVPCKRSKDPIRGTAETDLMSVIQFSCIIPSAFLTFNQNQVSMWLLLLLLCIIIPH